MDRLRNLLNGKGKLVEFEHEVANSNDDSKIAKSLGIRKKDLGNVVAKSVVYVTKENKPVLGILLVKDKVDVRKLSNALNLSKRPKIASPEKVLMLTGYEAGAVPPIMSNVEKIIDSDVLNVDEVYVGGGSKMHLLKINTKELLELSNAKIADIKRNDS